MPTYNPDDWQAWMRAAQGGDAGAYRRLLAALQPWLTAYFRRRLSGDARGGAAAVFFILCSKKNL